MKPKKPPEEEFDDEEIGVKRKKLSSIFKQAFSAKPPQQDTPPQRSEIFSPEQNVGKDGLQKYISEAKQNSNHGFNLKKQKKIEEKYDKLYEGDLPRINKTEELGVAPNIEEKRAKFKPKHKEKIGSRELKKAIRKRSGTDGCGDSVGEDGLQAFLSDIDEERHKSQHAERKYKPDKTLKSKVAETISTQTSIVPLEIKSSDEVGVRRASEYDNLRDPIPNFKLPSSPAISEKNKNLTTNSPSSKPEEKNNKVMYHEMREKMYNHEPKGHVEGVISTSNIPVGREGLAHYIKKEDAKEPLKSETSETYVDKDGVVLAQSKKTLKKELFMKIVIVVLLLTALVIVGVVIQELDVL